MSRVVDPRLRLMVAPALVLGIGLLLTLSIVLVRDTAARRERELVFQVEAEELVDNFETSINRTARDFESAVQFVAATHPGSHEEFVHYFGQDQFDSGVIEDPGVMVIEEVDRDRIDELLDRERALGNSDFEPILFPNMGERATIITRTSQPATINGIPIMGFDVTPFRETFLPSPESGGFEVNVFSVEDMLTTYQVDLREETGFDYAAVILGVAVGPDGEPVGSVVRFQTLDDIVADLATPSIDELSLELHASGVDQPLVQLGPDHVPEHVHGQEADGHEWAPLNATRTVAAADLEWTIDVWADDGFGPPVGLASHTRLWLAGIGLSILGAGVLAALSLQRHRLMEAEFERNHAMALAATDPLTGLLNRQGIIDRVVEHDHGGRVAVLFIDLDGFKSVNDSDGHDAGDDLLREVAVRLRDVFRSDRDLVARLGGDEFVVYSPAVGRGMDVDEISARVTTAIAEVDLRITASVGVVEGLPGVDMDVESMIRVADKAMYEAKRDGGNRFVAVAPGGRT